MFSPLTHATLRLRFTIAIAALSMSVLAAADEQPVSFREQIAPILATNCMACHGTTNAKGDFQLDTFEHLTADGYIEAGKPDDSHLFELITEEDEEIRMPKERDPLPADQVALVQRWIAEGAKYDADDPAAELVSIIPTLPYPDPPEVYPVAVPITALAFSPDGNELAAGGYHEVTVWSAADGSLLRRIKNVAERTYGIAYSPDGSLLAVAGGTPGQLGEVRLFAVADGALVKDLTRMSDVAFCAAFSPDGTKLAACGADRSIRIFDVASGAEEVLIEDHADWVVSVAYNHDGTRLVSASRDKTSKVFDTATGDAQTTYPGHGEPVFTAVFNADGSQVYSGGSDKKIHVWNPADAKKIAEIGGFGHDVYKIIFQDGLIFSCSADKQARLHGAEKRDQQRVFSGHADWIYSLAYHGGTKRLATGGYDGNVRIWNSEDGAVIANFVAAPGITAAVQDQQAAK